MNVITILHFLGAIWTALGVAMLLSLIPAFYFGDGGVGALLSVGLIVLSIGLTTRLLVRRRDDIRTREAIFSVLLAWLTASLIGAFPYILNGVLGFSDAIFESVSGFTTTGASVVPNIESWPHGLIFWRSMTHCLGGMGIVVMSIALLPLLGYGGVELFQTEAVGPLKDKLTPRVRETARALWIIYLGLMAVLAVALRVEGMPWFDSICHSFGAIATGGFSTKNASIGFYQNPGIRWTLIIFMLLGGTNFALHFRAFRGKPLFYFKDYEFRFWIITVIGAILMVSLIHLYETPGVVYQSLEDAAFSVTSIATTTGFVTNDFDLWGPSTRFILLILLFTGSCAGSTCGSIKMFRWAVIMKSIRLQLRRNLHPNAIMPLRMNSRILPDEVVKSIAIFIVAYISMVTAGALALMVMGVDIISAFSGTATCAAGCGPGLGILGATETYALLPTAAKYVLMIEMILGRLEIFSAVVVFTRGFWRP
jgi:trk system potassium uptake protein